MSLSVALQHDFGGFALDVAFDAPPGVTVLFGRSGSGKSSVVNAVAGLLKPQAGRIAVDGRVLFDSAGGVCVPPHRRRLGYVFQEGRLFPHLSVRQNLLYGRRFAPRNAPGADMDAVIDLLGIGALLDRRPVSLSGGERSRVALGRALLAKPGLILADEPLAALDEARKQEILPYFERLRDDIETPILYVSHAASEVARLATTVVVLEDGRVRSQGTPEAILGDPTLTPLGVRQAGAVLEATVAAHHEDGLSALAAGGATLWLPRVPVAPGTTIRVRIAAHEVVVALDAPGRISALNVLPATVAAVREGDGPGALVSLDTDAGRVLARVTRRSVAALGLRPGTACHAVLKSVAVAPEGVGR
jgi:molybdate transport system ATP-binding protein